MKKISIIIPAYNASRTIERCLDSIIPQSENCEIFVIDDGSTDNTYEICSSLSNKCFNLNTLKQNRGGVSVARNLGIEKASGEYIMFVDADDVVENDSLPQIIKYIDNTDFKPDLVMFGMRNVTMGGEYKNIAKFDYSEINDAADFYCTIFPNVLALGSPWGRLFRKEIIDAHNIRFDTHYRRFEDALFNLSFAGFAKRIMTQPVMGYNYIHNSGSASYKFFGNEDIFLNNGVRQAYIDYFISACGKNEALAHINRTNAFNYLYSFYSIYRSKGTKRKLYWLKKYWNAAKDNNSEFSKEYNSGIPKLAGIIGRKSLFLLHLFFLTIFTVEKMKLSLKRD